MNYKEGRLWKKGDVTYEASVKRSTRPYPLPGTPYGKCSKESRFSRTDFEFRGAGWATWDFGQESLLPALQRCLQGGRVVAWAFTCFDQPDKDGYEWQAVFTIQAHMQFLEMCGTENLLTASARGFVGQFDRLRKK